MQSWVSDLACLIPRAHAPRLCGLFLFPFQGYHKGQGRLSHSMVMSNPSISAAESKKKKKMVYLSLISCVYSKVARVSYCVFSLRTWAKGGLSLCLPNWKRGNLKKKKITPKGIVCLHTFTKSGVAPASKGQEKCHPTLGWAGENWKCS